MFFKSSSTTEGLYEFFKVVSKDCMKFVELEFEPFYVLGGLEEINEVADEKLKDKLPIEEYIVAVNEFNQLFRMMELIAVGVYMEFEDRVFDKIGVNKNLKRNIIKTGLKRMNIE